MKTTTTRKKQQSNKTESNNEVFSILSVVGEPYRFLLYFALIPSERLERYIFPFEGGDN